MKKIVFILAGMLFIAGAFFVANKLYIPQSPINQLSGKKILHILNNSEDDVVELTKDDQRTWYITKINNNGIQEADTKIKKMLLSEGWSFKDKDGSGLFFEKNNETLIVTTEMWTSKYVLIKVTDNHY